MEILKRPRSQHTASLLADVQQDLQVLFTSISESILLIEPHGRILGANDVSAGWLNHPPETLVGQNLFQLLTPHGIPIREWVYKSTAKQTIYESENYFGEHYLHFRLIPISEGKKIIRFILVVQDITEHKRAEEQVREFTEQMERKVRERTRELETLNIKLVEDKWRSELLAILSGRLMEESRDYPHLLEYIASEITSLIGDSCMIALFSQDLSCMEVLAIADRHAESLPSLQKHWLNRVIPVETNEIASKVLRGERYSTVEISKEMADQLFPAEFAAQIRQEGLAALEIFPLNSGDQPLGMLAISREHGLPYSPDEISFIGSLVSSVSFAIQNAQLFEQLTESQTQLRGLSQQLVQLQEEKFSHLAEELHDSIGQDMTAINVNLNILRTLLPQDAPPSVFSRLMDTERLVIESVKHMRSTMSELRPPMLDQYGLTAALNWYCEEFQRRTQIQVNIDDRYMQNSRMPTEVEIALFRIVQEALNNVAKHAKADEVDIELFQEQGKMMMAIRDNGCGFELPTLKERRLQHWGIPLMEERARAVNGDFLIRSVPGQGTQIVVRASREP